MEMEVEIHCNALEKRNGADEMFGSDDKIGGEKREVVGNQTETDDVTTARGEENNAGGEEKSETGYNREKPPEDDCCPICFGEFKVSCKANCGHWFCGNCILQLWKYRSRPRKCKCPFCSSAISKLTPEASAVNKTDDEVVEVLENIEQYNLFYVKGMQGFFQVVSFYLRKHGPFLHLYMWRLLLKLVILAIDTPAFIRRVFVDLIRHPERIRLNFHRIRVIACSLSLLLHLYNAIFPPGHLSSQITKIRLWIGCVSIVLVVVPYVVIMCKTWIHIWWLRFRIWEVRREVAALRAHNAALREQEAALRAQADALREREAALEENTILLEQNNAALQAAVEVARQEQYAPALRQPEASQAEADTTSLAEANVILQAQDESALRGQETNASTGNTPQAEEAADFQAQYANASEELECSSQEYDAV